MAEKKPAPFAVWDGGSGGETPTEVDGVHIEPHTVIPEAHPLFAKVKGLPGFSIIGGK